MVKCEDCGWTGLEVQLKTVDEDRGEFWGIPCYETMYYCPCCGSDCIIDDHIDDEAE